MAEKTPARLWLTAEEIGWPGSFRSFRLTDLEHPEEYPLYVRADSHDKLVEALKAARAQLAFWKATADAVPGNGNSMPFIEPSTYALAEIDAALSSLQTGETEDA